VLDDLLVQKLVDDPDVVYHMAATVGVTTVLRAPVMRTVETKSERLEHRLARGDTAGNAGPAPLRRQRAMVRTIESL
jgi:hypothetical protein